MNTTIHLLVVQRNDSGLTLAEVFDSLPADPTSLFALVLIVGFFGAMVYFGTRSGSAARAESSEDVAESSEDAVDSSNGTPDTKVTTAGGEPFAETES